MRMEPIGAVAPVAGPVTIPTVTAAARLPLGPLPSDTIGEFLQQASGDLTADLLQTALQNKAIPPHHSAARLLEGATAAAQTGDTHQALTKTAELIRHHPDQWETVASHFAFARMQPELHALLAHAKTAATSHASLKLIEAKSIAAQPPNVLVVAERLLESGRYPNIVLSADLSQLFLNLPSSVRRTKEQNSPRQTSDFVVRLAIEAANRLRKAWQANPVLLAFLLSLAGSLIAGVLTLLIRVLDTSLFDPALIFEIWGAGSAGIIGFGTYKRFDKKSD